MAVFSPASMPARRQRHRSFNASAFAVLNRCRRPKVDVELIASGAIPCGRMSPPTKANHMYRILLLLIILSMTAIADDVPEPARPKLYLTSAAINVLDDLVPLLPRQEKGDTDCYVVTAGNLDRNSHWITDEMRAISNTGRSVKPLDLAVLAKDELAEAFYGCAVIWVGGGNTFYLLQEVRRSGFDDFITKKIATGTPYVGTSAGSIILAPNIESVRFADDPTQAPDLASYNGLGLFPLVAFAHFDNPDFKNAYRQILEDALERSVDFVTLKEKQFIIVDGDSWKIHSTE